MYLSAAALLPDCLQSDIERVQVYSNKIHQAEYWRAAMNPSMMGMEYNFY
jgi:hypothetical protein